MSRSIRRMAGAALIPALLTIVNPLPAVAAPPAAGQAPSPPSSWLLLVYVAGPTSITQVGPLWPSEESCKAAKTATDAFLKRQAGNALVDRINGTDAARPAATESECVATANPAP